MKEERSGIYKYSNIGPVVIGFIATIFLMIIAGIVFFFIGRHPAVPTHPEPKNNKGELAAPPIPGNLA